MYTQKEVDEMMAAQMATIGQQTCETETPVVDGYHYRYETTTAVGDRKGSGYKVIGPAVIKLDSYSLDPATTRMALLLLNGESYTLKEDAIVWELEGSDNAVMKGESLYHDGFFRPQE